MRSGLKGLAPEKKYDLAYQDPAYASPAASIGLGWAGWVIAHLKFKSVLDVGCGSGHALLRFLDAGKKAQGTEVSEYLLNGRLLSLRELGLIHYAFAKQLSCGESSFDLVFCSEVLEHIPEGDIHQSISELIRVSSRLVFVSVCFREARCFPELKLHETVRPKEWWEAEFSKFRVRWKEVHAEGCEGGREDGASYVIQKI